ncbi:MAG: hypothetical protein D6820_07870, partial [Lentisphaerae bacterium]
DYVGLAVLPEPVTNRYRPEEIPFYIRNWDSRIREYIKLAARIGIRRIGLWAGKWENKPPYKASFSGVKQCRQLKANWIGGASSGEVEHGKTGWTAQALHDGAIAMVRQAEQLGALPEMICLGNEPHGDMNQVIKNVAAYKAVYEGIKASGRKIFVIGTSNGPDERYFKAGFQNYLDAYDFHTYESYRKIPRIFQRYRELFKKYNAPPKPIFCTEFGLNSQGMARLQVASELYKKFAVFFAEGGAVASWFTILYPDPTGKAAKSFGQAHCTFDGRYRQYNPKMDAVAYYHTINAIANKKFVTRKTYDDGTECYLFANAEGEKLIMAWNENACTPFAFSLAGAEDISLRRVDGLRVTPMSQHFTWDAGPEPVLIEFKNGPSALPPARKSRYAVTIQTPDVARGGEALLTLSGPQLTPQNIHIDLGQCWTVKKIPQPDNTIQIRIPIPTWTLAREIRIPIRMTDTGQTVATFWPSISIHDNIAFSLHPVPLPEPAVAIRMHNWSNERRQIAWRLAITAEFPMENGSFKISSPQSPRAALEGPGTGSLTLPAQSTQTVTIPLRHLDPQTLYRIRAEISDSEGHVWQKQRLVAGFVPVFKASAQTIKVDGRLDETPWQKALPLSLAERRQFHPMRGSVWGGTGDVSGSLKLLWTPRGLIIGVQVTDDKTVENKTGADIWNQDGLQFLFDPCRNKAQKPGKYDYSIARTTNGPQAWCHTSADEGTAPTGDVSSSFQVAVSQPAPHLRVYEIFIPWARLSPFKPAAGVNLGMAMIINDRDHPTLPRDFIGWFSGVHSKQLDLVGDLILVE